MGKKPRAIDPVALAERQLELDRERTKRFPELFTRKMTRMSASPLAYLRGAAPVFYEILETRPDLADGPEGEGWIAGDMHLENFGAYHPDPVDGGDDEDAVFNLNDFDDAVIAPWRFDLLRLTTSLLLGGRELGATGVVALSLSDRLLDAWCTAVFGKRKLPPVPPPVARLVDQVCRRSKKQLLDARTEVRRGQRRFVRGPRYQDLPETIAKKVPAAFARYVEALPEDERPKRKGCFEIVDTAFRIAGTGSLGGLRVAVLVAGKGGTDGNWIFDMKEQGDPSASLVVKPPRLAPAERVEAAMTTCLERPPRMIGRSEIAGISMFVRKLAPQEDKLNLRQLRTEDLPALASYLGALLGIAHRNGATKLPKKPWSRADLGSVRDRAIDLAGLHEAVYLALSERIRHLLPQGAS